MSVVERDQWLLVDEVEEADLDVVRTALPEIAMVQDERLRRSIELIWVRLWRAGGWPDITAAAYSLSPEVTTGLVEHTRAVVHASQAAASALIEIHGANIDLQKMLAVALLHDASKLIEYEAAGDHGKQYSQLGLEFPHATLGSFACLAEGLDHELAHEVLAHTMIASVAPRSLEGVVLFYVDMACADFLRYSAGASLHLAGHASQRKH